MEPSFTHRNIRVHFELARISTSKQVLGSGQGSYSLVPALVAFDSIGCAVGYADEPFGQSKDN